MFYVFILEIHFILMVSTLSAALHRYIYLNTEDIWEEFPEETTQCPISCLLQLKSCSITQSCFQQCQEIHNKFPRYIPIHFHWLCPSTERSFQTVRTETTDWEWWSQYYMERTWARLWYLYNIHKVHKRVYYSLSPSKWPHTCPVKIKGKFIVNIDIKNILLRKLPLLLSLK